MNSRQEHLLSIIVKEHIDTGTPVGSSALVEKYDLDISSATVRNEMAELEAEGYIVQPHTSAGRIPTEHAFQWLTNNLCSSKLTKKEKEVLDISLEQGLKPTAKALAGLSGLAVFWAFHRHNVYYTGFCNLLEQPEFYNPDAIYDLTAIIDRVDEIVNDIFDQVQEGIEVMIGKDSPFGSFSGVIVSKYVLDNKVGLFGVLGPLRMDYSRNLALVQYLKDKIK
ncbi:MAG: hypothetical protein V1865_01940 [bacterium]